MRLIDSSTPLASVHGPPSQDCRCAEGSVGFRREILKAEMHMNICEHALQLLPIKASTSHLKSTLCHDVAVES